MKLHVELTFDAAHRLEGYEGACRHIHGHTYRIVVTLSGHDKDGLGFLIDFRAAKALVKQVLAKYDHALMLKDGDPLWGALGSAELADRLGFKLRLVSFPDNPTAEEMAQRIKFELGQELRKAKAPVVVEEVRLWETPTSSVTA